MPKKLSKKEQNMKAAIQSVIQSMMDRVMNKVLVADPFIKEEHRSKRPLYAALVPDEIFKGSHFERRFVTPFGNAWEQLAVAAAKNGLGYGEMSYRIDGRVRSEKLRRITEVLNRLEHRQEGTAREKPEWERELSYVRKGRGELIPVTVVCDVFAQDRKTGERLAFELKAPMPNSDQTKVSKEKMMKLYCMEPSKIEAAYYALPYNPYGRKEDYAWTYPARWFNMREDEVVLIGDEFWERIGGRGTYQSFIRAVNEIGKDYRDRIYREYLGIEPPADADEERL